MLALKTDNNCVIRETDDASGRSVFCFTNDKSLGQYLLHNSRKSEQRQQFTP